MALSTRLMTTRLNWSASSRTAGSVSSKLPHHVDVAEQAVVERQGLDQHGVERGRHRPRRRHPRELRELVDQALERLDLADDRRRALADQRGVRRVGVAELALQPLGRQLDRRQRVLDLVRQPARHLAPRRHLLGADERRDVVEHDHRALEAAGAVEPRRRHRQGHLAAVAGQRHFLRDRLALGRGRRRRAARSPPRDRAPSTSATGRPSTAGAEARAGARRRSSPGRSPRGHRSTPPRWRSAPGSSRPSGAGARPRGGAARARSVARSSDRCRADRSAAMALNDSTMSPNSSSAWCSMRCSWRPGADLARRRRQHLHRPRDALGQVQAHPRRADQDEQRDHDEERQVDAGQRLLQHPQLGVVLVGLRHAPGPLGHLAGEVRRWRRSPRVSRPSGARIACATRRNCRPSPPGSGSSVQSSGDAADVQRGQAIGRRPVAMPVGTSGAATSTTDCTAPGAAGDAVDLHQPDAPLGDVGRDHARARRRRRWPGRRATAPAASRPTSSLTTRCRSW